MTNTTGTPSSSFTTDNFTAEQQQQLFSMKLRQIEKKHAIKMQVLRAFFKGPKQHKPKNELKPEVFKILKSFPSIPWALLLNIFKTKFDLYNLYKLCTIHSNNSNNKQHFLLNSNNNLKFKKVKSKLKNYNNINLI